MRHLLAITLLLMPLLALTASEVTGFTLVDATSDAPIATHSPLVDGAVIDLAQVGHSLNIRADVDGSVGKVSFTLSGAQSRNHSESAAPYALFGDSSGDYNVWSPEIGSYTLSASADGGTVRTIAFSVSDGGSTAPPPSSGTDGNGSVSLSGERKRWHKLTLDLQGPHASEAGSPNPFLDYRMTVTFTNGSQSLSVPGYFAADGNAAETGATAGSVWRAHFAPQQTGTWSYTIDFRYGPGVAVNGGGTALTGYHGKTGSFSVSETDKTGRDFRGKGRLQYVGGHYLRHMGSGELFIKMGADAPETLLAYQDFDNTSTALQPTKTYSAHVGDWRSGDPTWRGGKGKGLIGAVNYLATKGMNVMSFLPYNAGSDGKNVWPYSATTHGAVDDGDAQLRMDCSKLAQWEIVFEHATRQGIYLHFKTQETEIDNNSSYALDGGALGTERKLYYRELIARFGHHLALNWNLGEENTNTDSERKAFAQYFHDVDPYDHHIVVHTYPSQQETVYRPLLGSASKLTGASVQTSWSSVHSRTRQWIDESAAAGKKWVVANDEQGAANDGIPPDPTWPTFTGNGPARKDLRHQVIWGNLMAGGAGVETYFGNIHPDSDMREENFRSRDGWWDMCRHAKTLFDASLPLNEMSSADPLVGNSSSTGGGDYCFAKVGTIYACYFNVGSSGRSLDLSGVSGSFSVQWYDPRNGGALRNGTVTSISGGGVRSLGEPPATSGENDWVALVRKSGTTSNAAPVARLSASPSSGTAPLDVSFNGSASSDSDGSVVSWQWSFGDGSSATGATVSHRYSSPGSYTARLTVTDDDGATASTSTTINVAASTSQGSFGNGGQPRTIAAIGSTRIQAEDYDLGGEGVAYHDLDSGNTGGAYRSDGVDLEATADSGGGTNIGWIKSSEWLEYSIDVVNAGSYRVELRVARKPSGSVACHLEVAGSNLSGAIGVPSTGGWQNWTTVDAEIRLAAGPQVLRLAMDGDDFNVNWLELSRVDPGSSAVVAAVNAGGGAYTAGDGTTYAADAQVSGGRSYTATASIAGTEDDPLYQSERYGNFSYAIPVPDGDYILTLHFAEVWWTADGKRVFDVSAEGVQVVSDLDLHATTGGRFIAHDLVVPVSVADGSLDLVFSTDVDNAKLSALRLEAATAVSQ